MPLLAIMIYAGLWRLDAYRVTSTVSSVPGIQVVKSIDLAEEDFGGPEIFFDLRVGGHRLELFDVTVESLGCGAPILLWHLDSRQPSCRLERDPGYWSQPGINLCAVSPVWKSTISSVAALPERLEAIVLELSAWPSTPAAGLILPSKDGEWRCFLSPAA